MAVVALTPVQLDYNDGSAITQGAGTAIVAANTNTIVVPRNGKLLVFVDSDHANTAATFAAGGFNSAGQGSVAFAVANGVSELFVVGETSRLKNSSGLLSVSWAAGSAGFIRVFQLPIDNDI